MSFESKMKKHIAKVFEENVPNPYVKEKIKKPFSWSKLFVPLGVTAVACAVIVAIVLPTAGLINKNDVGNLNDAVFDPRGEATNSDNNGEKGGQNNELVERISCACAPKLANIPTLDSTFVTNTASKSLQLLEVMINNSTDNYVISPASFLLSVSGLAAVSDNFVLSAYGLNNSENDAKTLLEEWNCYEKQTNSETGVEEVVSRIDSGILHQQIGSRYNFDNAKIPDIESKYIGTSVTSTTNYRTQAQDYFENEVKLNRMVIPNLNINKDCIITYSGISFEDNAPIGKTGKGGFQINGNTYNLDSCIYGSSSEECYTTEYYSTPKYIAFTREIRKSSLLFVVPKTGYSLNDISISQAYSDFIANKEEVASYGYIPYFSINKNGVNVGNIVKEKLNGDEKLYSKLLDDSVSNAPSELKIIQSNSYDFYDDGTSGESVGTTRTPFDGGSSALELNVDRPFYALVLKDNFPIFVNKVIDPRK